jgi:hypothetical protein
MFIEFGNTIINTNYLGKIVKSVGNSRAGVIAVMNNFENEQEWFSSKEERDERYNTLLGILSEKS